MRYHVMALAGLLVTSQAQAAPDPTVHYSLKPVLTDGQLTAVEFDMRFQATQAQTEVDLPDRWARGKDYYKGLKDIEITGATAVSIPANRPAQRILTAAPGAEITVRYHVDANLKAGEEAPIATDMTYPVVGPNRFYILGESVWSTVAGTDERPVTFSADMPAGWAFASNLQDLTSLHGNDSDVAESILVGGTDLHIESIQTSHTRLRIASAGRFDFTLADFTDRTERIIATEQAFWNDGQPSFLVTLAPISPEPGHMSSHGEGRPGAFAIMTVPDAPLETVTFSLAHEYFHSWNPEKLGQTESGADEALSYWFSEGFTDYYGRKLAFKAGVVSLEQFIAEWNEALDRYANSPHRTAPNTELRDHQWADETWHKIAYDRGSILAAYLNAEWRTKGVTLDRFIHTLRDKVAADPGLAAMPTEQRVASVAAGLGVPASEELARFIDRGEAITLPEDAFGGCIRVIMKTVPDVDYGFDLKTFHDTHIFRGVKPDSPAYTAGLRDGMAFLTFKDKDSSDSSMPATFEVRDTDGKTQTITYLPQGKTSHVRQQLMVPAGLTADQAKACAAAITS